MPLLSQERDSRTRYRKTNFYEIGLSYGLCRLSLENYSKKHFRRTYHLQGLGRHTLEEQRGFARRDLQALQDAVGAEGFLFGDTPNVYDFTVASLLAGIYDQQPPTWVTEIALEYLPLKAYTERVQLHTGVFGRYI